MVQPAALPDPHESAELARGAGYENPPDPNASWEVLTVKRFGTRTGLLISDGSDSLYFLRFDVPRQPEMMTGAQVVSGKFFWALGYWTTQDYLVNFNRSQLQASEGGKDITSIGKTRPLHEEDIDTLLNNVASDGRAAIARSPTESQPRPDCSVRFSYSAQDRTIRTTFFSMSIAANFAVSAFSPHGSTTCT